MKLFGMTSDNKLIPIRVDADGHLQFDLLSIAAGDNLIGRVDARGGDKIFSYNHRIGETVTGTSTGVAGTQVGASVPAGEVWKIEAASIFHNEAGATPQLEIHCVNTVVPLNISIFAAKPTQWIQVFLTNPVTLSEGDFLRVHWDAVLTNGKACFLGYWGWSMEV